MWYLLAISLQVVFIKLFLISGYKERWFKLVGNFLFYYRLNQHGNVYEEFVSKGVKCICRIISDCENALRNYSV